LIWSSTRACAPAPIGGHRDHRADADDDAEHRERRAQLVDAQRGQRDLQRREEAHGSTRSACAPALIAASARRRSRAPGERRCVTASGGRDCAARVVGPPRAVAEQDRPRGEGGDVVLVRDDARS
jgi:hypothetical protein